MDVYVGVPQLWATSVRQFLFLALGLLEHKAHLFRFDSSDYDIVDGHIRFL